jgi:hypothetical protein
MDNNTSRQGSNGNHIPTHSSSVGAMLIDTAYSQTGEPFYVEQTKSTGISVVDVTHGPKVEVSFAGNGTINRTTNVTDIGTIY